MTYLALFLTLPTRQATPRMRAWRALRALGCATLRDGVYLLPNEPRHSEALGQLAREVREVDGSAELYHLEGRDTAQDVALRERFDRSSEYSALIDETRLLRATFDDGALLATGRQIDGLRRRFEQVVSIDFFPGDSQARAREALEDLDELFHQHFSSDEPTPSTGAIPERKLADYRGRLWATRARPWVDRLASAWLIRRFIDPEARILWLAQPEDCPSDALGFDFNGATFTHVGDRVTFETLIVSFGLVDDRALTRIGRIVHYLDVGGTPVAEAAGIEAILSGMRARIADDDALLEAASSTLEFLYHSYSNSKDPA